jgi:hypothetical protein
LSTAIIITNTLARALGKLVCGDMSRDTTVFFLFGYNEMNG